MLRYRNSKGTVSPLVKYKDLCIEETLEYGDKSLNLTTFEELDLESYIITKTDEFVIKQKNLNSNGGYDITASLNIEELEGKAITKFETVEQTSLSTADLALAGTGWVCECTVQKKRTIRLTNTSAWLVLKKIVDTFRLEMKIDSLNKKIIFQDKVGVDKGIYYTDELNLKSIDIQSNSTDFYTRILPLGKDGLTIESVAGNKIIENYTYSNKKKTYIWKDERYTNAQSLYDDAVEKLNELAQPYIAYSCNLIDLGQSCEIGDVITLIDKYTHTRIKQRIVKLKCYPENPDNNTCEISNLKLTFSEYVQKYNNAADTVDNITNDNGTVDGDAIDNIDASKVLNLETVIANNAKFIEVSAEIVNISKELQATSAKVGDLEVTKLSATDADLRYANIKLSNIEAGSIKTAMIDTGAVGTAQIADGSITDAKIVDLTANKITSGTIDAANIEVINLKAANITVGTINGKQIAEGAIDTSKFGTDVTDWMNTTDKDIENAAQKADTANTNAAGALSTAEAAKLLSAAASKTAEGAQLTADGKNTVFYQTTAPLAESRKTNDIWFNTADSNKMYYFDGKGWVLRQFGTNAIANASITNALIADATIQNAKIANMDAGKITSGYISADRIASGSIVIGKLDAGTQNDIAAAKKRYQITVDLRDAKYNTDTYYPVLINSSIPYNGLHNYECNVQLNSGSKPVWSTHNQGFTCNLILRVLAGGWRTTDAAGYLEENNYRFCNKMPAFVGQVLQHSQIYFMLRGGARYYLYTPNKSDVIIYTAKTNIARNTSYTVYLEPTQSPKNDYAEAKGSTIASWCAANNKTLINGGKIYTGSVTATQIAANAITTEKIAASAVNAEKIAASAITSAKIAANAITTEKIVANAVTAAKIASKTITANQIAANSITAAELSVSTLSAISANLGTVTAGVLKSSNYVANSTGMMLNLATGTWDSKYFKISSTGDITSTSGIIGGWYINSTGLSSYKINSSDGIKCSIKNALDITATDTQSNFIELQRQGSSVFNVSFTGGVTAKVLYTSQIDIGKMEYLKILGDTRVSGILTVGDDKYGDCDLSVVGKARINEIYTNYFENYGTTKLNYIKQNTNYWADLYNLHVYGDSYYEGAAQFNARLYVNNTTMGKVGVVLNRNITPDISFGWDGTYLRIYIDNTVIASYHWGSSSWV